MPSGRKPKLTMAIAVDYGYINARVRGMKSRLFDRQAYHELVAKADLAALLASLAQTPYREAIEAALVRSQGLAALIDGLRRDLTACLLKLRRIAGDDPAEEPAALVRILLARWDYRSLLTLTRAQARGVAATIEHEILIGVGDLDAIALAELARQPDLPAMIDLLSTWRLPYATPLRRAWLAVVEGGELSILEEALGQAYAASIQERLQRLPPSHNRALVQQMLGQEIDVQNLLNALRLRQARLRGELFPEPSTEWYLPGGRLPLAVLASLLTLAESAQVLVALRSSPAATPWLPALTAWAAREDLVALQRALERRLTEMAQALFVHDPLTIAPVIAYVWAKENEVRNLRVIGWGIAEGWERSRILEELCC